MGQGLLCQQVLWVTSAYCKPDPTWTDSSGLFLCLLPVYFSLLILYQCQEAGRNEKCTWVWKNLLQQSCLLPTPSWMALEKVRSCVKQSLAAFIGIPAQVSYMQSNLGLQRIKKIATEFKWEFSLCAHMVLHNWAGYIISSCSGFCPLHSRVPASEKLFLTSTSNKFRPLRQAREALTWTVHFLYPLSILQQKPTNTCLLQKYWCWIFYWNETNPKQKSQLTKQKNEPSSENNPTPKFVLLRRTGLQIKLCD